MVDSHSPILYKRFPLYARLADRAGTLEHVCSSIQPELDEFRTLIASSQYLFAPRTAPTTMLDWLGQWVGLGVRGDKWLGIGLNPEWPPDHKRRVIERVWRYWQIKGTLAGIQEAYDLWLQWPLADQRVMFFQPWGDRSMQPPGWWGYATPFGSQILRTAQEQVRLGSGDTPGVYQPPYVRLEQPTWQWSYAQVWTTFMLQASKMEKLVGRRSHMGPRNLWQHIEATPDEWRHIFPDIHDLQPEILEIRVDPVIVGWLSEPGSGGPAATPSATASINFDLVESQASRGRRTVREMGINGFQFSHLFPYNAALPSRQERTVTREEFGMWPGFSYFDSFGRPPWWYKAQGITETVTEITIPGQVECNLSSLEAQIKVGEEATVETVWEGVPGNQTLTYNSGQPELTSTQITFEGIWPGFSYYRSIPSGRQRSMPPIDTLEIDTAVGAAIETFEFETFEIIELLIRTDRHFVDPDYFWYAPPHQQVTVDQVGIPASYRLQFPIRVFTHQSRFGRGLPWYWSGTLSVREEEVVTDITQPFRLCNIPAYWTDRTLSFLRDVVVSLPPESLGLLTRFPDLMALGDPSRWQVGLETTEDLILLRPQTFFWQSVDGSTRAYQYSQATPVILLEVVFESRGRWLSDLSLMVDQQVLHHRTFDPPLAMDGRGAFGFRFRIMTDEVMLDAPQQQQTVPEGTV